ncbi:MAG: glycosyltransferase [Anaerolineales bacterium]|nr:glycosyltransferase [Anaerolineales bacterium]
MISIIIRTHNEERWIRECLRRIQQQTVTDVEIVLVDNNSTDQTVARAKQVYPGLTLVTIDKYLPGLAINAGIRASNGEYVAILSAHCLPVKDDWLATLLASCEDKSVAGVYGRQIPTSYSSPQDKRDLLVTFGLDKRVQKKDIFFHNANSLIRRELWQHFPFDEQVTNIEDRVWAKQVIDAGYVLVYEPDAAVFHYHGIYQNNDERRIEGAVRVMEVLEQPAEANDSPPLDPGALEIAAIIPVRAGEGSVDASLALIERSVQAAKDSKYIDRIILASDDAELSKQAQSLGVDTPFVRPVALSQPGVRADEVLRYSLEQLEKDGYSPDLVVPLEVTYPFRPAGLLDKLILLLTENGLDTAIAAQSEHRPYWQKDTDGVVLTEEYAQARQERTPLYIGLLSLGCVTYAEFIRQQSRLGKRIGVYEVQDPFAAIEIREPKDLALLDLLSSTVEKWRAAQP